MGPRVEPGRESESGGAGIRRVVCVAVNASIDKVAAVDRLVPGEIHRPDLLSVVPGGKAINVARAATRLGLETVVVPVVAGHAGSWLVEALATEGIPARPIPIAGETRTCLSILDRSSGRLTEIYEAGPPIDPAGWGELEAAIGTELAANGSQTVVVMSGSLLAGSPDDGYARIVALARQAGARAVVDADGSVLAHALAAGPWLVKVNATEAARATGIAGGDEMEALAGARALRDGGARVALVTRGTDGALLVDDDGAAWRLGPSPEHGPYPVGSGDSFLAGFLRGIAGGATAAEAARWAVAAGAANALRPGQGAIDAADVDRIRPLVPLSRILDDPPKTSGKREAVAATRVAPGLEPGRSARAGGER